MSSSSLLFSCCLILFSFSSLFLVVSGQAQSSFSCACQCCTDPNGWSSQNVCSIVPSYLGLADVSSAQCNGENPHDYDYCTEACIENYPVCPHPNGFGGCLQGLQGLQGFQGSQGNPMEQKQILSMIADDQAVHQEGEKSQKLSKHLMIKGIQQHALSSSNPVCSCFCAKNTGIELLGWSYGNSSYRDSNGFIDCFSPCIPLFSSPRSQCSRFDSLGLLQQPGLSSADCSRFNPVYFIEPIFENNEAISWSAPVLCYNAERWTIANTGNVTASLTDFAVTIGLQPDLMAQIAHQPFCTGEVTLMVQQYSNGNPVGTLDPNAQIPFGPLLSSKPSRIVLCGSVSFNYSLACSSDQNNLIPLGGLDLPYIEC